jgi:phosphoribosylamine--glycine ligase
MRRLKSELAPLLLAAARGDLKSAPAIEWDARACATIVYAARGYPEAPMIGSTIRGLQEANAIDDVVVFIASARRDESGALIAAGGRVLSITALGVTLQQSVDRAYRAVDTIDWPEGFFRRDIGWRALPR